MVKIKTYPNGLRLIVKRVDGVFSVSAGILVGAGSRYETPENNGISHFIEHMTFKGTEKRSAFDISDAIDSIGGQINAFTTKETTCYYVKSTAEHLGKAVEVLSDIFFNSTYDEQETEKEKGVVIEEINMNEDTPDDLCMDLLAEAHFGKTGLGATILGPEENVRSFTAADMRSYTRKYYHPENIVVCFSGNVTFEEAEALADEYFADNFKSAGKFAREEKACRPLYGRLAKNKDIEQAHVCLAYNGCAYDDETGDYFMFLNTALGGGMSSRLFQKVREEMGLAYSVFSYNSSYRDCGTLCVYAGVNPKKTDTALDCILREIGDFKRTGLTEKEFIRAKEQIKGSFIFSQESNASQMLLYSKYLLFTGKVFDFEKKLADINAVTLEGLNAFIREKLDLENHSFSIVAKNAKK